jgi:hypothetical protein
LFSSIPFSGWLVWRTSGFAGAALPLAIYLVQLMHLAVAALSGLGHFRCGAQLHNLAHESGVSLQRER